MDFELTDEQHALQEVIHDLVERDCPPKLLRAVVEGRDDGASFWDTLVEHHWPALIVDPADGGSGASTVELVIALEELGWGGDPSPFLATASQYVPMVQACAPDEVRHDLLQAVSGGGTGTVAWAADAVGAERDGDGWRLQGTATTVFDGDRADRIAVVAGGPEGVGVFVVAADDVDATRRTTIDGSVHFADVTVDGVTVAADSAFASAGVDEAVERATQVAVAGLAALMVGASQHMLDLALDHVKQRQQFGVAIGSFQAVKHMAVDVYVAIQRARALCQFAGLAIAEDDERRGAAASMAKAAAGDAQRIAARHCVQLFGGLGYTWENDLQLYLKRAKVGEPLLGSTAVHRARAARFALGVGR